MIYNHITDRKEGGRRGREEGERGKGERGKGRREGGGEERGGGREGGREGGRRGRGKEGEREQRGRISNSTGCQDSLGGWEREDIVITESKEREGTG